MGALRLMGAPSPQPLSREGRGAEYRPRSVQRLGQDVSANSSRPISMRRISLVPAPIS